MTNIISLYEKKKQILYHSKWLLLVLVLVIYVTLWIIHPKPLSDSDPLHYAKNANIISQGKFFEETPNRSFAHRLAVTVPVAAFYKTFGINTTTTYLWSLINALIIITAIWFVMPADSSRMFAILLVASAAPLFKISTSLLPDIVATTFMFLSSILLYYRQKVLTYTTGYIWFPLIAAVLLFLAFLSKLSAYWVLPLWILCFIIDCLQRKFNLILKFYIPVLVLCIILGTLYLLFSKAMWGDFFARLSYMKALDGNPIWSWEYRSNWSLIKRLTISPAIMLFKYYGIIPILFFFGLFVVPKSLRFWAWYSGIIFFLFWFGSISFKRYEPLTVTYRMILPALPGMCIVGGYFFSHVQKQIFGEQILRKVMCLIIITSITFLPMIYVIQKALRRPAAEKIAMQLVKKIINANKSSRFLMISSDSRSPKSLRFYFDFSFPENLTAIYMKNISDIDISHYKEIFFFVRTDRSDFLKSSYGFENFDTQILKQSFPKLYKSSGVYLFHVVKPFNQYSLKKLYSKFGKGN